MSVAIECFRTTTDSLKAGLSYKFLLRDVLTRRSIRAPVKER